MPYIKQEQRSRLDPLIEELAYRIEEEVEGCADGAFAGLLNYTCTRLALRVMERRFGGLRYWLIAIVTGVFKNISDEFYRRLAVPYEEYQLDKNGDVPEYRDAYL